MEGTTRGLMTMGAGALLLLLGAEPARALETLEVTTTALPVRAAPDPYAARVAEATKHHVYPVLDRRGLWRQIQFGSGRGWAYGGYLRPSSHPARSVTASSLNVRSGPATRYRVLGALPRGTWVVPVASQGAWRRIDYAGREAWVHGAYLADAPSATAPARPRSRAGFVQLAAAGPGFSSYTSASKRWGLPNLVYGLERTARRWAREHPSSPRIGIGDLSLANGGPMPGHASHQRGNDADLSLVRNDGREWGVTWRDAAYSRWGTQRVIDLLRAELTVTLIFFNDPQARGVQYWPGHDNHLHVRIQRY